MAVHPLDLFVFVIAVVLLSLYSAKIGLTGLWSQQQMDKANQAAADAQPPELNVNCWVPDHFSSSAVKYSHTVCTSKFTQLLEGGNPEGIRRLETDVIPSANSTGEEDVDFEAAQEVYRSGQKSGSGETQGDPSVYYRLYTLVFLMVTLTLVSFAIAVAFGRVARSHAGYLEMAWMNALRGSREPSGGTAAGGKGPLLEKSGIIGARVEMLWSTKTLAIGYLLFQVIVLLLWFILGMCCYQGSTQMMDNINQVHQLDAAMGPSSGTQPVRGDRPDDHFTTMSYDGEEGGNISSEEAGGYDSSSEEDRPRGSGRDSGVFLCEFGVRLLGNIQRYTIQCGYDVSRDEQQKSSPSDWLPLMMAWHILIREGMIYALIIDALILVHIITFFLLGPLSRQRSLLPVLKGLEVKPTNFGIKFGFTDLSFVASFAKLNANGMYMVDSGSGKSFRLNEMSDLNGEKMA